MDWPVATVLLGTLGTLAVAILKWLPRRGDERAAVGNGRVFARATDMAEIRARLDSLEQAHHVLRAEIRADMKELQRVIWDAMGGWGNAPVSRARSGALPQPPDTGGR